MPSDWQDKVMHGSVTVGGQVLMGADVAPEQYEAPAGFTHSLNMSDESDAERIFEGSPPPAAWSCRCRRRLGPRAFGLVVDRSGIPWQINCEGSQPLK